jgi:outer membrane biosynthesis protein TonB
MATKRYGANELVRLLAHLAKPIADAWRAEGGPGWWARARGWMARKLRAAADRLAPAPAAITASVTPAVELPSPVAQPEPTPAPEPISAPTPKPAARKAPAKPKATPKPKAKPVKSAARTTKAKTAPKPATTRKTPARKRPAK